MGIVRSDVFFGTLVPDGLDMVTSVITNPKYLSIVDIFRPSIVTANIISEIGRADSRLSVKC